MLSTSHETLFLSEWIPGQTVGTRKAIKVLCREDGKTQPRKRSTQTVEADVDFSRCLLAPRWRLGDNCYTTRTVNDLSPTTPHTLPVIKQEFLLVWSQLVLHQKNYNGITSINQDCTLTTHTFVTVMFLYLMVCWS